MRSREIVKKQHSVTITSIWMRPNSKYCTAPSTGHLQALGVPSMTGALQAVPFINTLTAYACSSDGRPFEKKLADQSITNELFGLSAIHRAKPDICAFLGRL